MAAGNQNRWERICSLASEHPVLENLGFPLNKEKGS